MSDLVTIIEANALPLIVALVIGVAVGWWIWARTGRGKPRADRWEQPAEAKRNAWADRPAEAAREPEAVAPPVIPEAGGDPDDLSRIKGLGPKLLVTLSGLGVTRYDQIAAWTPEQLALVDAQLGAFKGRPERDNWIEQAGLLARGEIEAYETKFGKIGGP